ncbi:cytochrome b6-f complex iron-sulfur subunit [Algoriphagus iocasae]|uniref:Cytochrome b6-f complex iron-sulfur subunit n=1 Tax=Algoriphagus iocasae TaxID=1836499 RepID=A0A841MRX4_9BACT|nr:Rieske 2Fe-2S domain-containing protein [Algoriphagus iocasae]MBB6328277.1 cytochrome b6-f complex iron-sulfur subunit [Algoriphagus iocasae]
MDNLSPFQTGNLTNSRREFIEKSGVSIALSFFGIGFFTSCSDSADMNPNPSGGTPPKDASGNTGIMVSGNTITVDLKIQTGLNMSGGWLLINNAKVLVSKVGGTFVALTSVCTHSGCDTNWSFTNSTYNCSCHGSKFDAQGNVVSGPATNPLKVYSTEVNGDVLTIKK